MPPYTTERVLDVQHWDRRLFSFTTTRPRGLNFEPGQFVLIGVEVDGRMVLKPYNIASAHHAEHLEFCSIHAPDGDLSSRFQHIEPDASLVIGTRPNGTLVIRDLRPGARLLMLSFGTGIAPFASIMRDPRTYEKFEQVILLRSALSPADLAYGDDLIRGLRSDARLGKAVCKRLLDYPSVIHQTNRDYGRVLNDLGLGPLHADRDRLMICGSMQMLTETTKMLEAQGFESSSGVGTPGDFLLQRAFVERAFLQSPEVRFRHDRPAQFEADMFAVASLH